MQERYQPEKRIPTEREFLALFKIVTLNIRPYFEQKNMGVLFKEPGNHGPQTEADRVSHSLIFDFLATNTPHPVLSEESEKGRTEGLKNFWIIDPIDGTRGLMDGTGGFSMMIGLVENGKAVLGAVYFPLDDELYFAKKGQGAFLIDHKGLRSQLRVSSATDLGKLKMLASKDHLQDNDLKIMEKLGIKRSSLMQCHGFGTKACWVAEGSADLYVSSPGTKIWDSIPNIAIVEEAGGKITDLDGNDLLADPKNVRNDRGVLITNGLRHAEIIKRIKELSLK